MVFLTPLAGLVALAGVLPLAGALLRERRLARVRGVLGLERPARLRALSGGIAAAAAIGLLGLAAAQPAIARDRGVRGDAEAYVVLDSSRSMAAVPHRGGVPRLARAKALALRLRDAVPGVRWGVASFSDRTLVHAFPTADRALFADTLTQSVGIQRPPPVYEDATATSFDTLAQLAIAGFFSPHAKKRVAVVFTDGESRPFTAGRMAGLLRRSHVRLLLVRLWGPADRVYDTRGRDLGYRPVPSSAAGLASLGRAGIETVPATQFATVPQVVERWFGRGGESAEEHDRRLTPLAPAAVLAAIFPLGFALARVRR